MAGIALTNPIGHASDTSVDIEFIGTNYGGGRVLVRSTFQPSGTQKDTLIGPGGVESIAALVAAVPNFANLRLAMLQHLQDIGQLPGGIIT